MASLELGPIWRSVRRHRAFTLLVVEVALGFFIIGNLVMTIRWYSGKTLPPSGHREQDVVEVTSRRPLSEDDVNGARLNELRRRERATLAALPGVSAVAAISSTQLDAHWTMNSLYWAQPGAAQGPSTCAGVSRGANDRLVGWDASTEPSLIDVVDLKFVAGDETAWRAADTVVVTKCLADALFGGGPALGQTLYSMHRPPARITGVIQDIRLHMPFLFQTNVVALYDAPPSDPRMARWLVRTQPGRAEQVRVAATPALEALDAGDSRVDARLFTLEGSHGAHMAGGTVVVLVVVGIIMGLLAMLGNLAVAAFLVGDRRRILGVRRALGATRWDIFRYLLIENLIPTQLGNLLGIVALLATLPGAKARFAGLQLHLSDALLTALMLSIGALLAKLVPALRAMRIPPSEVTRSL